MVMKKFKMTTTGAKELESELKRNGKASAMVYKKHLLKEAEGVMAAAKQLVPVDTGSLRASGHVQVAESSADSIKLVLGFGGPAARYALVVHEDLDAFHPVGTAKYLEKPFVQSMKGIEKRILERLKRI